MRRRPRATPHAPRPATAPRVREPGGGTRDGLPATAAGGGPGDGATGDGGPDGGGPGDGATGDGGARPGPGHPGAGGGGPGERLARVALSRIGEPGDAALGGWLATAGAEEVWRAVRRDRRPAAISAERWAGFRLRAERADPSRDLARAAESGARFVSPGDPEWPTQLDDLGVTRPVGVWVRGVPSLRFLALRSVAVVGARACTDYGGHVAAEFAGDLARDGWTVVSGAAFGIDGAAHRGALAAGGSTVAVLACGVDVCYPAAHRELVDAIARQGLVVSELPPGDHPTRARFLQRNRVLAALTRGTVVVEAAVRSGALVTARHARRLGRHLMGVAGSVYSSRSEGVHQLLREDAVLVTRAAEITELVGRMGELAEPRPTTAVPHDLLAARTARVLDAVPTDVGAPARDIARGACTSERDASARLRELHALGFVERLGDLWLLSRRLPPPPAPADTPTGIGK